MIKLGPRHFLAERVEDLPAPRKARIFLDAETRSHDDSLRSMAVSPYLGDRACMWALAFDDDGPAVAVPYRMRSSPNMPVDAVKLWLADVISNATEWVNHGIKFDAHVAALDGARFPDSCKIVDTLTYAKIIDTDRFSHDLKDVCKDWLSIDTSAEDRVAAFLDGYKLPRNAKAKCYALVPSDILGFYNCEDVLMNRDLFHYCERSNPEQTQPTWEMEKQLTPVLWDMESIGLRTDEKVLKTEQAKNLYLQIALATKIAQMTGLEYKGGINFIYGLLVGAWGLPILARDKKSGNPTFNADALKMYLVHPEVVSDKMKFEVLSTVLKLREAETFASLFIETFLAEKDERGYVHTEYNQLVRTGRMSAKKPNSQQFDASAKKLIFTDGPNDVFHDADASQIEFRIIAHYIKDPAAISAYNNNPNTDFHTWVAELCKIKRRPAKTVNFSTAFGAGMNNIISQLAANEDIISEVTDCLNNMIAEGRLAEKDRLKMFEKMTRQRGKEVYQAYHDNLPTLKPTAKTASAVAAKRGFIFNLFGRRRHLPQKAAHVAFNTICQGTAMDIIKRRMIDTAPRYNPDMRRDGITLRINVHDAVVHHGDREAMAKWSPWILDRLNAPVEGLRVPIRWDVKVKGGSWG